jgi:beta-glucosidase
MKYKSLKLIAVCTLLFGVSVNAQKLNPSIEGKITTLLKQMTLEEKAGQMAQVAIDQIGHTDHATKTFNVDADKLNDIIVKYKVGSILNTPFKYFAWF